MSRPSTATRPLVGGLIAPRMLRIVLLPEPLGPIRATNSRSAICSVASASAQTGAVRPGLTLDDGTLVVTDNYLKVRIPAGLTRNERVNVRIGPDIDAAVMPSA